MIAHRFVGGEVHSGRVAVKCGFGKRAGGLEKGASVPIPSHHSPEMQKQVGLLVFDYHSQLATPTLTDPQQRTVEECLSKNGGLLLFFYYLNYICP